MSVLFVKLHFYALNKICRIRPFLSLKSTEKLVHVHVMSRLDYSNGILFGLADNQIQKCKEYKMLPQGWSLEQRSMTMYLRFYINYIGFLLDTGFNLRFLVFLCINDLAPSYLQELLVQYRPSRNLRSQSKSLLVSPRINTQFYGAISFQSFSPEMWNNIPDNKMVKFY